LANWGLACQIGGDIMSRKEKTWGIGGIEKKGFGVDVSK
jgi:hypothetical protein